MKTQCCEIAAKGNAEECFFLLLSTALFFLGCACQKKKIKPDTCDLVVLVSVLLPSFSLLPRVIFLFYTLSMTIRVVCRHLFCFFSRKRSLCLFVVVVKKKQHLFFLSRTLSLTCRPSFPIKKIALPLRSKLSGASHCVQHTLMSPLEQVSRRLCDSNFWGLESRVGRFSFFFLVLALTSLSLPTFFLCFSLFSPVSIDVSRRGDNLVGPLVLFFRSRWDPVST